MDDLDISTPGKKPLPPPPPAGAPPRELKFPDDAETSEPVPPKKEVKVHASAPKQEGAKPSPPLFIKIEKYREVVKSIQELKSHTLGLRDALDALADVEKELRSGLEITQRILDKFNSVISLLDSKLLRFGGVEEATAEVPGEIDSYVKNLYNQVERIRHELRTIED